MKNVALRVIALSIDGKVGERVLNVKVFIDLWFLRAEVGINVPCVDAHLHIVVLNAVDRKARDLLLLLLQRKVVRYANA